MNNLLSYCGLVDARISASEKDVPVRAPPVFCDFQLHMIIHMYMIFELDFLLSAAMHNCKLVYHLINSFPSAK